MKRQHINIKLSTGKTVLHFELENGAEGSENHSDLTPSEYREYQDKLKQMRAEKNKRHLTCCCCSGDAGRWAQHWNRDEGYGICFDCIQWIRKDKRETEEDIKSFYGIEGINWGELKND